MPVPYMGRALRGWVSTVQIKKVKQVIEDSEVGEVTSEESYRANFQPMSAQNIQRVPAEYRGRKLWTVIVHDKNVYFKLNDIIEDPAGIKYRVEFAKDWRSGGYTEYGVMQDYE